nr:MAG TPA: hypothetical protein [Microviridae sp.]
MTNPLPYDITKIVKQHRSAILQNHLYKITFRKR